jgi:hypothetical protein
MPFYLSPITSISLTIQKYTRVHVNFFLTTDAITTQNINLSSQITVLYIIHNIYRLYTGSLSMA